MNRIYAKLLAASALAICAIAPASAQTPVTVSAWGTPVTIVGGGKPNGPAMLDQNGQIPVVNLEGALDAYVTKTGLTEVLNGYLTTSAAAKIYLPLYGGTLSGNLLMAVGGSIGNGKSLTFFPTIAGVGAPVLWSSSADSLTLGTNDGGSSHFIVDVQTIKGLTGSGNAYSCLDASGTFYRSATACN